MPALHYPCPAPVVKPDITTAFEAVFGGSNPSGGTRIALMSLQAQNLIRPHYRKLNTCKE